jgi:hypothetical protein
MNRLFLASLSTAALSTVVFSTVVFSTLVTYLCAPPILACQPSSDSLSPTALRLREAVKYLASDELAGRAPGTDGNEKALRYIVNAFRANGLTNLDTSYFQRFPVLTSVTLGRGNKAVLKFRSSSVIGSATGSAINSATSGTANANVSAVATPPKLRTKSGAKVNLPPKSAWELGTDYMPLAFSEDSAVSAGLVFVGYGISAKELGYDDYANADVRGKIVIALRGTPESNNPHSAYQKFAALRSKALNAREHGAVAIIFVNSSADFVGANDDLPALRLDRTGNSGIVAIQAKCAAINAIFASVLPASVSAAMSATTTLQSLEAKIAASKQPSSFALPNVTLTLSTDLDHTERMAANVIGWVRGTDTALAGEYIVVGAHCDHLGMGEENSLYTGKEPKIHYGADDNASGTAGMLELAAAIAQRPLRRSVLFMAFNAEESGLLGSQWYCKHPLVSLDRCAFMLNMDMIGRMKGNALSVHGTGTSSRWETLVDSLGRLHQFAISKSADGFGPSDHASFYAKNLPVLFLFTGIHEDYHKPSDTWDKINYPGQAAVVRFAEDVLRTADVNSAKPDFVKVQTTQVQRSTGFRVYVGTIPDYSDHPKGMRITGVREGSPAQKAGLQEGDVIIKLGESRIKNVYDYTYALGNYKAGDKTTVVVLRETSVGEPAKELALELMFEVRK